MSGWLSGKRIRLSHGRSWVCVPAGSYQRPSSKMVQTASLHGTQCVRIGVRQRSPTVKKAGTVYGDMHLKDLLGSIVRVGYCISVPDFYLVLHGLHCRKSTIMD